MAEQAFTPLLEISQHTNAKLHAIVVATGSNIATLPADDCAGGVGRSPSRRARRPVRPHRYTRDRKSFGSVHGRVIQG